MKSKRINRNKASEFVAVSSLPRVNRARLNFENYCPAWPINYIGKWCFKLKNHSWKIVGWSSPPYRGSGSHAIVIEKIDIDNERPCDLGIYWFHGEAHKMKFENSVDFPQVVS